MMQAEATVLSLDSPLFALLVDTASFVVMLYTSSNVCLLSCCVLSPCVHNTLLLLPPLLRLLRLLPVGPTVLPEGAV
jgi:hypothetical protein